MRGSLPGLASSQILSQQPQLRGLAAHPPTRLLRAGLCAPALQVRGWDGVLGTEQLSDHMGQLLAKVFAAHKWGSGTVQQQGATAQQRSPPPFSLATKDPATGSLDQVRLGLPLRTQSADGALLTAQGGRPWSAALRCWLRRNPPGGWSSQGEEPPWQKPEALAVPFSYAYTSLRIWPKEV